MMMGIIDVMFSVITSLDCVLFVFIEASDSSLKACGTVAPKLKLLGHFVRFIPPIAIVFTILKYLIKL